MTTPRVRVLDLDPDGRGDSTDVDAPLGQATTPSPSPSPSPTKGRATLSDALTSRLHTLASAHETWRLQHTLPGQLSNALFQRTNLQELMLGNETRVVTIESKDQIGAEVAMCNLVEREAVQYPAATPAPQIIFYNAALSPEARNPSLFLTYLITRLSLLGDAGENAHEGHDPRNSTPPAEELLRLGLPTLARILDTHVSALAQARPLLLAIANVDAFLVYESTAQESQQQPVTTTHTLSDSVDGSRTSSMSSHGGNGSLFGDEDSVAASHLLWLPKSVAHSSSMRLFVSLSHDASLCTRILKHTYSTALLRFKFTGYPIEESTAALAETCKMLGHPVSNTQRLQEGFAKSKDSFMQKLRGRSVYYTSQPYFLSLVSNTLAYARSILHANVLSVLQTLQTAHSFQSLCELALRGVVAPQSLLPAGQPHPDTAKQPNDEAVLRAAKMALALIGTARAGIDERTLLACLQAELHATLSADGPVPAATGAEAEADSVDALIFRLFHSSVLPRIEHLIVAPGKKNAAKGGNGQVSVHDQLYFLRYPSVSLAMDALWLTAPHSTLDPQSSSTSEHDRRGRTATQAHRSLQIPSHASRPASYHASPARKQRVRAITSLSGTTAQDELSRVRVSQSLPPPPRLDDERGRRSPTHHGSEVNESAELSPARPRSTSPAPQGGKRLTFSLKWRSSSRARSNDAATKEASSESADALVENRSSRSSSDTSLPMTPQRKDAEATAQTLRSPSDNAPRTPLPSSRRPSNSTPSSSSRWTRRFRTPTLSLSKPKRSIPVFWDTVRDTQANNYHAVTGTGDEEALCIEACQSLGACCRRYLWRVALASDESAAICELQDFPRHLATMDQLPKKNHQRHLLDILVLAADPDITHGKLVLQDVDLSCTSTVAELAHALTCNTTFSEIRIESARLSIDGLKLILKACAGQRALKFISLAGNDLSPETVISAAALFPTGVAVEGLAGMEAMAIVNELVSNQSIELKLNKSNKAPPEVLQKIIASLPLCSSLRRVCVSHHDLDDDTAIALVNALTHLSQLSLIDLSYNKLTNKTVYAIVKGFTDHTCLRTINLSHNKLRDDSGKVLGQLIQSKTPLRTLNLCGNLLQDNGSRGLAEALKVDGSLEELSLAQNKYITYMGIRFIAEALRENKGLKTLSFADNIGTGDQGASIFAEALHANKTLEELNMKNTNIHQVGKAALSEAADAHPALTIIF